MGREKPLKGLLSQKYEAVKTVHTPSDDVTDVKVWSVDSDYKYTFFNNKHKDAMKSFWGAEISLGCSILDYLPEGQYLMEVEQAYSRILKGENHRSVDHFISEKGHEKYFENFGHPITDKDGTVTGIMFYTIDNTRKTELENRLIMSVALLESIMNSPRDIHILSLDRDYRYTFFNNAHFDSMRDVWNTEPEIGCNIFELLPDPARRIRVKDFYDKSFKGEVLFRQSEITDKNGDTTYYENISSPVKTPKGEVYGITIFVIDISERVYAEKMLKESLFEKEILLKEIHHRVKNNLQIITSMINLQLKMVEDESVKRILQDSLNRINTMGQLHRSLYQGDSLAEVKMEEYLNSLLGSVDRLFESRSKTVKIETRFEDISLEPYKAIPVGLIVNELVTNSCKHAFEGRQQGSIFVGLSGSEDSGFHLSVGDDGIGLQEESQAGDTETLGTRLVSVFVTQLKGRLERNSSEGLTIDVYF